MEQMLNQLGKKLKIKRSTSNTSEVTFRIIPQIIDNHKIQMHTNKMQGIKRGKIRTTITKTMAGVRMFIIRHMKLKMAKIDQITIDSRLMISIVD